MDFPLGTLILPEPQRAQAWHRWRADLEFDTMSYESQQTLPALAARLPQWLEGDALASRIQGIVKLAWSRNQVRLHLAAEARDALLGACIAPVAIVGPLAWSLRTREDGAIRTIRDLTLLISRGHVFNAVSALGQIGWELQRPRPDRDTLDWSSNLALTKGDETLHLHWRLGRTSSRDAVAFEEALMARSRTILWKDHEFQTVSAEADLLHRLMDRPPWDPVPWQADVLMMPLAEVEWPRFQNLATEFASFFEPVDVLGRLTELRRDWHLPVPELAPQAVYESPRFARLRSRVFGWGSLWRA